MFKELLPYWPQIVVLVWYVVAIIVNLFQAGTERFQSFSKFESTVKTGVFIYILKVGGFFNHFSWPQLIYSVCIFFFVLIILFIDFDKINKQKRVVSNQSFGIILFTLLYWWGGFFDGFIQYLMTK